MTQEISVAVVPPGQRNNFVGDSRIDKIEIDPELDRAFIERRIISDEGQTTVDRALVTSDRKQQVADAMVAYEEESEKVDPDPQVQLAALEKAISFIWDVVSGEDIGSEARREEEAEVGGLPAKQYR